MIKQKSVSLADQVFERLEGDIQSGKYARGEVITELKLCEELGVSRTPVREALRRLEQEHMIEETGKGMIVLGITSKDAESIYEIRLRIEGLAARDAARYITPEQIEEMRETVELQEFYVSRRDSEKIRQMDSQFHRLLYKYSHSTVFYDTLVALHRKVQKYRKQSIEDKSRAIASTAEHRALFEAIAAHDSALAEQLAVEHVGKARDHIVNMDKERE